MIGQWVEVRLRYLLLAPTVLVLVVLTIFPTIYLVGNSILERPSTDSSSAPEIGLGNFVRLLGDDKLHNAVRNTLILAVVAVSLEMLLGLALALLADRYLQRMSILKTILLLPMMLPPIAVAIIWKLMYQPQFGVLNDLLRRLGGEGILWTSGADTALASIILVDIWQWTPFVLLMCLAGLAGLPREPYEAAELDGANAWQKFRDLTWPFLRPVLAITLLLRVMDAIRLFDQVYVLTRGGPAGATETISYYIYKVAFRFFDIGYAAAISLVVLAVTIAASTAFMRRMRVLDEGPRT